MQRKQLENHPMLGCAPPLPTNNPDAPAPSTPKFPNREPSNTQPQTATPSLTVHNFYNAPARNSDQPVNYVAAMTFEIRRAAVVNHISVSFLRLSIYVSEKRNIWDRKGI